MLSRENLKLTLVAVACLLLAWTGPSIAHGVHAKFAHNADKVDGKHAVGAGAGLSRARGKLVAHASNGQLPAKFIPKVTDADRVDGLDSGSLVTESEYVQRPGTKLLAAGVVGSNGQKASWSANVGEWTVRKVMTGFYMIEFANDAITCSSANLPYAVAGLWAGVGFATYGGTQCTGGTKNVGVQILTRNTTATLTDFAFSFAIYGKGTSALPMAARAGGRVLCRPDDIC